MRWIVLGLLLATVATAQEFPPATSGTLFDCTTGCSILDGLGVQCWSFVQPATADYGPRCRSHCQYDGQPAHCPGPGWISCHTDRVVGVACNVTEYVRPPLLGRTRSRVICDGGTANGLVQSCP